MLKPPAPRNEIERIQALQHLELLDTPAEHPFDELVRLASALFQVPIALVSLVDSERQWFKAKVGLEASETPRDVSFCGHAILGEGVFEIPDAHEDPRFFDNPLVTGPPHVRFYAGAPIRTRAGHNLGSFCIIDHVPRRLTPEQREILTSLAAQTAELLELRRERIEQEHQAEFRAAVLDSAGLGIIATDAAGIITGMNRVAETMLGYAPQDMIGQRTPAVFLVSDAGDTTTERGTVQVPFPGFGGRRQDPGEAETQERTLICKDGTRRQALLTVTEVRDSLGTLRGYMAVARELSEQRDREPASVVQTGALERAPKVWRWELPLLMASAVLAGLLMLGWGIADRWLEGTERLREAVTDAQLHVLDAHRSLEEYLWGDEQADVARDVLAKLDDAAATINELLNAPRDGLLGRVTEIDPLGKARPWLEGMQQQLIELRASGMERIRERNTSGAGSSSDLHFDMHNSRFQEFAALAQSYHRDQIQRSRTAIRGATTSLFILLLLTLLSMYLLRRWRERLVAAQRMEFELILSDRTQKLTAEVMARRSFEIDLRDSETRLRSMLDSSQNLIMRLATDTRITYVNSAWFSLLGYRMQEAEGKRFIDIVAPADRASVEANLRRLIAGEPLVRFEATLAARDGRQLAFDIELGIMEVSGRRRELRAVLRDVTGQRAAEAAERASTEMLRAITQHANVAIVTTHPDGRIVGWNPAAERMFRAPASLAIGELAGRIIPQRLQGAVATAVRSAVTESAAGSSEPAPLEFTAQRFDGGEFPVEVSISRWTRDGQEFVTGVILDISERRKTEDLMLSRNRQLEQRIASLLAKTNGDSRPSAAPQPSGAASPATTPAVDGSASATATSTPSHQQPVARIPVWPVADAESPARRPRVLVVDDNPPNRHVLRWQLNKLGCDVEEAFDGISGFDVWQSGAFECLFVDCQMPNRDGYEMTRHVRAAEAEAGVANPVPIIAYTANVLEESRAECFNAGMNDVLIKPATIDAMRSLLARWLAADSGGSKRAAQGDEDEPIAPSADHLHPVIDSTLLSEISGGDLEFEREMLGDFLGAKTEEAERLIALLVEGDLEQVSHLAHRLKGAARTIAAVSLAELCSSVERAAKASDRTGLCKLAEPIRHEFDLVTQHIGRLNAQPA